MLLPKLHRQMPHNHALKARSRRIIFYECGFMRKKEKWVGARHWYDALDVVRYGHILMQHNAAARVQQIKRLHGVEHGCKILQ